MAEALAPRAIPVLDLADLGDLVPDFELVRGYRPEITWPSPTCTLPRLPLRLGATQAP
ncbi:hypothetical protein [Mycobacterium parmense]|uniref:Uncharacterized protein n=1 Tax=Mycobacterium parmense TaxID=185642 RepID=A0A7I7YPM0_9MYCO|nr:hypothetical protein [Mycobacterium parmense]MCV7349545.1 hypothetical protein [Mycobacterium parmense]BBZ43825.1 hypothetical protein MPRM_11060 [Mycobacterium parmense]